MPCFYEATSHNGTGSGSGYQATTRPASFTRSPTQSATAFGTQFHAMMADAERAAVAKSGLTLNGGWSVLTNARNEAVIEQRVGGTKRVDVAYVDHFRKRILIVDYFTGSGSEPLSHWRKGLRYFHEPDIQKLIDAGYEAWYSSANPKDIH